MPDESMNALEGSVDAAAAAIEKLLGGGQDAGADQGNENEKSAQPQEAALDTQEDGEAGEQDAEDAANEQERPATEASPEAKPDPKPVETPRLSDDDARKLKEADQAIAQSNAERNHLLNTLTPLVAQLQAAIAGEFADIKTNDDLLALGDSRSERYDPDRFNRFQIARARLADAQAQQAQLSAQVLNTFHVAEGAKLRELIPDLKDPTNGPKLQGRLINFVAERGYTADRLKYASAADMLIAYEAMLYHEGKSERAAEEKRKSEALAEAKKKASGAPPVQKPGTARTTTEKGEKAQTDFDRFKKSGRVDDAAAVLSHIL